MESVHQSSSNSAPIDTKTQNTLRNNVSAQKLLISLRHSTSTNCSTLTAPPPSLGSHSQRSDQQLQLSRVARIKWFRQICATNAVVQPMRRKNPNDYSRHRLIECLTSRHRWLSSSDSLDLISRFTTLLTRHRSLTSTEATWCRATRGGTTAISTLRAQFTWTKAAKSRFNQARPSRQATNTNRCTKVLNLYLAPSRTT